jgi:hypothetical protein
MGRYSPTYLPETRERDYGSEIANAIGGYIGAKRQEKRDTEHEEEVSYQRGRREKLDPLEEALLQAQLYEHGIVRDEDDGGVASAIDGHRGSLPNRGNDLFTGRAKFGDRGAGGLFAPGSFNPATGSFNPPIDTDRGFTAPRFGGSPPEPSDRGFSAPGPGRDIDPGFSAPRQGRQGVSVGGGYHIDPSRTPEGRKESIIAREIEAAVRAGVPRDEAELEIRGGGLSTEHFHPGAFHPKTRAEYDELERTQHLYRLEEVTAAARARRREEGDPALKERRDSWKQQLGTPRNQLEQDVLDFLADGEDAEDIPDYFPESRRAAVESYLSGEHADVEDRRYELGRGARRRPKKP